MISNTKLPVYKSNSTYNLKERESNYLSFYLSAYLTMWWLWLVGSIKL